MSISPLFSFIDFWFLNIEVHVLALYTTVYCSMKKVLMGTHQLGATQYGQLWYVRRYTKVRTHRRYIASTQCNTAFLIGIAKKPGAFKSMYRIKETGYSGMLEGFFECQACKSCPANIISMADVEDKYPVTYRQGEAIVVHMDDRDIEFVRREKMYMADFSDWGTIADRTCGQWYSLRTSERENLYHT